MSTTTQLADNFEQPGSGATRWWTMSAALMLILYELGWMLPWFQVMMGPGSQSLIWRSVLLLGGMLTISYLAARFMEAFHLLRQVQLAVLGVLLLVGLLLGELAFWIPAEEGLSQRLINLSLGIPVIAVYVVFAWYRGFTLAHDGVRPVVVWKRFRFGLVAMLFYLFFVDRLRTSLGPGYAMAFLFFGLFGMILTRIGFVNLVQGAQKNPFDRRWSISVAGTVGLVILFSGLLSSLLTGRFVSVLDLIKQFIQLLITVVLFILNIPALIVAFVIWPIIVLINQYLAAHPGNFESLEMLNLDLLGSFTETPAGTTPQILIQLTAICFWFWLVMLAVMLLLRARRAYLTSYKSEPEAPEDILKQGEARRLVRQALQEAWEGILDRLRPAQRRMAAARIRQIYQDLMDLCAARKMPRQPACTPLEFLPEMAKIFPEGRDDLGVITQAYIRVRYGEYPESVEEVDAVEVAWKRVSELARTSGASRPQQDSSP
jgi:hypothetical protein